MDANKHIELKISMFCPVPGESLSDVDFRSNVLIPFLSYAKEYHLIPVIDLDNCLGYTSTFLYKVFFNLNNLFGLTAKLIQFKSEDQPSLVSHIRKIMNNPFPYFVNKLLVLLNDYGKAYLVGGSVRDYLLNKQPHDYDIATSLKPKQIKQILLANHIKTVDNLGENFGTVVAVLNGESVEITTFRSETYGTDPHRPESVEFATSLKEDLSRRDFTINAIAMDVHGKIYDFFGGRKDLKLQRLKTVGNPADRFKEDPLRMWRACRFVSTYNFNYVEDIEIKHFFVEYDFWKKTKASSLSIERVKKEFEKLLLSENPEIGLKLLMTSGLINCSCQKRENGEVKVIPLFQDLIHLKDLPQNEEHHKYDVWGHIAHSVKEVDKNLLLRWTMFLHDTGKGLPNIRSTKIFNGIIVPTDYGHAEESAKIARTVLTYFGYKKHFIDRVCWLISQHMRFNFVLKSNEQQLKHWLRTQTKYFRSTDDMYEGFYQLSRVMIADSNAAAKSKAAEVPKLITQFLLVLSIIKRQFPISSQDLAVNGHAIVELLKNSNFTINLMYKELIKRVQDGSVPNDNKALLNAVRNKINRLRREEHE